MPSPIRIAIVASVCVPHDAISSAVLQTYRDFEQSAGFEVHLFAMHNAVPGLPAVLVGDCCGLLLHKDFLEADLIIYHFGIYYDLFDTLLIGNGKAKRIVVFHNITPKEFVSERHHAVIDKSFTQLHNITIADSIWADSEVNRKVLLDLRIDERKVKTVSLSVSFPALGMQADKPRSGRPSILFVGRAVRSKGLLEALDAVAAARDAGHSIDFTIAGNIDFSDTQYLADCHKRVQRLGLEDVVHFAGTVSSEELAELYRLAHVLLMSSFHEGFCMPIIEALRAGCIPVGFAAGNIPHAAEGLGRLAETGDVECLGRALIEVLEDLQSDPATPMSAYRLDRGLTSAAEFARLTRAVAAKYAPAILRAKKVEMVRHLLSQE